MLARRLAVHEAMRLHYGRIASENQGNPGTMKNRMGGEMERWRLAFGGAKTVDQFRHLLCDFFSRGGSNAVLRDRWHGLLGCLEESRWQLTRDLALLALVSYKGKENEVAVFEKSFIVYAEKRDGVSYPEELYQFAIDVCRKYNQDSVCVKLPDTNPIYYKQDESIDYEFKNGVSFNDATQTYFTDLYRINNVWREGSKATRFSLLECYIAPSPQGYSEGHSRYMHGERFLSKQV